MKKIFLSVFVLTLLLVSMSNVSAFYYLGHEYWTITGFDEVDSAITMECSDKLNIVIDGNAAADIFVIHYTDSDVVGSYVATHTKFAGYERCMQVAGPDQDLKCFCYGIGLHNIQDHFAHGKDGLVPKYIARYFSSNLIGHMAIENDFEIKQLAYLEKTNDPVLMDGRLYQQDSIILNTLFEDPKYVDLLSEITVLTRSEVVRDLNVIANGYKGGGFYNTVYEEKVGLPAMFWYITIAMIILGLGVPIILSILMFKFGNGFNIWALLIIIIYVLIAVMGVALMLSIYTGDTWAWVNTALRVVPIRIADADIVYYNDKVQKATNEFLKTKNVPFDDNSGLSYRASDGSWVEGELGKAELPFKIMLVVFALPLFTLLNIFLVYRAFNRKKKGAVNKIMNLLGWILMITFILLIVLDILLILFA